MNLSTPTTKNARTRVIGAVKRKALSPADCDVWAEYGARKRAWVAMNGYSNPAAYDAMIRRVRNELGI